LTHKTQENGLKWLKTALVVIFVYSDGEQSAYFEFRIEF
jgi:hypothetical protein